MEYGGVFGFDWGIYNDLDIIAMNWKIEMVKSNEI